MHYQNKKQKTGQNFFAIIAFMILGLIAYQYFNTVPAQAQTEDLLTSTSENDSPFKPEQLALLAKIQSIKLDSSLFTNKVFVSLQDWTVSLGTEESGRNNPFAPIAGISAPASTPAPAKSPARR